MVAVTWKPKRREPGWGSLSLTRGGFCRLPTSFLSLRPPVRPLWFPRGRRPQIFLSSPNTSHFLRDTETLKLTDVVRALKQLILHWRVLTISQRAFRYTHSSYSPGCSVNTVVTRISLGTVKEKEMC